jgi:TMEM175 potassium channel family protein
VTEARRLTYPRKGPEFARALAFSDGLFAISMTLLVVGITVPTLTDGDSVHELAEALNDLTSNFVSFFVSFAVIGRYWVAHHTYFAQLESLDRALIALNLVYLAFIAFLPFPTALLGTYFENPLSIVIYAVNVSLVSGMEVVLFRHAYRAGLLKQTIPLNVYRWGAAMSLSPVVLFLLSVPVAFVDTGLAVTTWLLVIPVGVLGSRWAPEGADELLVA